MAASWEYLVFDSNANLIYNRNKCSYLEECELTISFKSLEVAYELLSYTKKKKIAPTVEELGRLSGLKTRNSVYNHLNRLKETGIVTWEAGESRTLKVLQPEYVISEYLAAVQRKKEDYVYE